MSKMEKREYRGRIVSARPAYTAAFQTKLKISTEKKSKTSRNSTDFHNFSAKPPIPNKGICHKTVMPSKSGVTYSKRKGKGERMERPWLKKSEPDSLVEPTQGSSNEDSQPLQSLRRSATYVIQKWKTNAKENKKIQLNRPLYNIFIGPHQKSSTISQNGENIEYNNIVILKRPVSFSKLQSKIQASQISKIPINIIYLKPYKNWTDICELTERIIAEERRMSTMSQAKNMKYETEYNMVPTLKRSATYIIRRGKPETDNKPSDELKISQISRIISNNKDAELKNSELKQVITCCKQKDEIAAEQAEKTQFVEVIQDCLIEDQPKTIDTSPNESDVGYEMVPKLRRSETYTISRGKIGTNLKIEDNIKSPQKSKIPRSIIGIGLKKMEVLKRIVTFAKQKGKMEAQWMGKKRINELYLNSVEEPTKQKPTRNRMDNKSQNVSILKGSKTYTKYKPRSSRN
ncbi:uncharacterized protein LOC119681806 [Teleopsis dalmanni]|uniref:uncharacterized protein LOC119681806 n=1 Tax=Teleopsis dalmanni TaxID=139649 RepID=UPI0018CF1DE9|nr:uncharacterized protein LOC119681806 [Teleopsis dalmanni]